MNMQNLITWRNVNLNKKFTIMQHGKTPLLKSLLKNIYLAIYAKQEGGLDFETARANEAAFRKSRRDFIVRSSKAAVVIGVASAFPFLGCVSGDDKKKGKPVIAIVGGGIAGLCCAYELQRHGITATIYEADKRTGGRILTRTDVVTPGIYNELGGEYIDTSHKTMIDLCCEFGLTLMNTHEDCKEHGLKTETFFINDRHYTEEEVFKEFKKVVDKIAADIKACKTVCDEAKKMDDTDMEKYIRTLPCDKWLQDLLVTAYTAEYGLDASEQSSLNFIMLIGEGIDKYSGLNMYGASDEVYKIQGGNQRLPDTLAGKLKDNIKTGCKLTEIKSDKNKATLKFENGTEAEADYVVLAIPFSVLRDVKMDVAGMKPERVKWISELGYGQNNKLIFGVNNRVWREAPYKCGGYVFDRVVQNGWDSSQMQHDSKGPGSFTVFLGGKQSKDIADKAKQQGLKDGIPDDERKLYAARVDKIYNGTAKEYNGNAKAMYWSNNPFVKGSYACFRPGQYTSDAPEGNEPVGNVFFAGEHCSERFQGFMEGGAETGTRAAREIMNRLESAALTSFITGDRGLSVV